MHTPIYTYTPYTYIQAQTSTHTQSRTKTYLLRVLFAPEALRVLFAPEAFICMPPLLIGGPPSTRDASADTPRALSPRAAAWMFDAVTFVWP